MRRYPAFRKWRGEKGRAAETGRSPECSTPCYTLPVKEISQRQLRNDSGEIMRGLDEGESYIVTRNGSPVGELTPLHRHRFVTAASAMAIFRGAPAVEYGRLREDLDTIASQEALPRG